MRSRELFTVATAVWVCGCGGGGGGSSFSPVNPSTTFRVDKAGDSWTYSVTAQFSQFGRGTGTLSEVISADTYLSAPSLRETRTFDLAFSNNNSQVVSYTESAPNGTLRAETNNSGTLVAVKSTLLLSHLPSASARRATGVSPWPTVPQ